MFPKNAVAVILMIYLIFLKKKSKVQIIILFMILEFYILQEDPMDTYLIIDDKIGEGGYCIVYQVTDKQTQKEYAMKVAIQYDIEQACTELYMQITLHHPNIISFHSCYCWEHKLYVFPRFLL